MRNLIYFMIVLLLAVLVIGAAFLFLDFRAMQSRTAADSQVGTASSGEPTLSGEPLYLYVQAPSGLEEAARQALVEAFDASPLFGQVSLLDEPASDTTAAVLVVDVSLSDYLWTPVYARAEMNVQAALASDGRVSWSELGEVDTVFRESGKVRISADLGIADRSAGILSRPAYRNYLAQELARRTAEALLAALQGAITGS